MPSQVVIQGFPRYTINDCGEIKSIQDERVISTYKNYDGIVSVTLYRNGAKFCRSVAVLVAKHFVVNDVARADTVIHLDGDRSNLCASNLAWRTRPFALAYNRQFKDEDYPHRIYEPLRIQETGEVFPDSFQLAITYGLLERAVVLSAMNIRGGDRSFTVYPTNFHILYE